MKKILLMGLSLVLVAVLAVGGTFAYFTDTDSEVNVMTVGNVKIAQNEQQRVEANGEFTSELESFRQGKILLPVTYPGNRTADEVTIGDYTLTLSDDEANYVDKIISVTNDGNIPAYVRTLVAIPTGGDEWVVNGGPVSANNCWLHWNIPSGYNEYWTLNNTPVRAEVNGIDCWVWEFVHNEAVEPEKTTFPMVRGFYMDKKVNHDDEGYYMTYTDGTTKRIKDFLSADGTVNITVITQAVQSAGFENAGAVTFSTTSSAAAAKAALDEAFGVFDAEKPTSKGIVEGWFNGVEVPAVVNDSESLVEALEAGESVILTEDVKIDPAGMSNAYGTTGINVKNGQTIDGGGNTLDIKGAGGTWDSGINTTGGTIKNITVTGSFRGIFINHNSEHSERVILENVIIDGTVYTISCDQGSNQGLTATDCTFNGWTSYAATLGDAEFIKCNFGEGSGYAFMRPYAPTTFVDCDFEAGYEIDPRAAVTFENCTLDGVALTADNLATLVTSNIANATVK